MEYLILQTGKLNIKNVCLIAAKYGYKKELITCKSGGYLIRISDPVFKAPYPRILDSDVTANYAYAYRMWLK